MIAVSKKRLALICLACVVAGWWLSSSPSSPLVPAPQRERPVLRWIAKAAKNMLWLALLAEPPPEAADTRLGHARLGSDGQPLLDHARGW
jgi:hypothetical protein